MASELSDFEYTIWVVSCELKKRCLFKNVYAKDKSLESNIMKKVEHYLTKLLICR